MWSELLCWLVYLKCDIFGTFLITFHYIPLKLNEQVHHENVKNLSVEIYIDFCFIIFNDHTYILQTEKYLLGNFNTWSH